MNIRKLEFDEINAALQLAWSVFCKFVVSDFSEQGVSSFYEAIHDEKYIEQLCFYGAFEGQKIIGILALRNNREHIALFFVDEAYQHQGIA